LFEGPEKDDAGSSEYAITVRFDGEDYVFAVAQQLRK
jgi:hypothetical protein